MISANATSCRLLGGLIIALAALCPTIVTAQSVTSPQPAIAAAQQTGSQDQEVNTGTDFVRPLNLFQLMYQFQTAPGNGAQKGTISEVTTDTANLRVDHRIDFAPQWSLALRADLPFLAKNPISSNNPDGDYLYGVGDADVQAALVHDFNERWGAGFGARLIAPTGGDTLGSGKWRLMPGAAVRYALPEISAGSYLEPLVRYDASFAGDPARRNISNLQFAPTFNIGLPNRWFLTFYPSPDIRVNYGDPVTGQTGRLFLPLDARIGRKLTDNLVLSLEVGVPIIKDYPVYNFKTQVRLNLTY
jgi:Putative MetA-pathway of phenol degradation